MVTSTKSQVLPEMGPSGVESRNDHSFESPVLAPLMTVLAASKPQLPAILRAQGNYCAAEFCFGCSYHMKRTWTAELHCSPESPALKFVFNLLPNNQLFPELRGLQRLKPCGGMPL